ncbi:MAG TPA: ABC transporter permease [Kiritimatiellia bacterium]|nr:ABC transporter permease [Kiritimatiellia bacterium]HMO99045.1 ABC transporter permease [Kiritimatiellia bacterium]HMP96121.1 ABC transporter permease [Kiritimatiellia bacterium]
MNLRSAIRLVPLSFKQLIRHRVRTLLTVIGIGAGMFLYALVESMQAAVTRSTSLEAGDVTLVVYRENRYCPSTSRLPLYYEDEIRRIPGVREVIPIQITVNNCGASLDIVTFRGVPPRLLARFAPEMRIIAGTLEDWERTDDGALIGKSFAKRRALGPGDAFEAAGVRVRVSGVLDSPNLQDNDVAYVHLPFLQQASRRGLGEVTQFNVRVEDPARLAEVAAAIDAHFATAEERTHTQPEKAFFAQAASELIELMGFTRWIGFGAVVAVLGLIANAVLLVARTRIRENAVLQTLGYSDGAIAWLVLLEGLLLGLAGGVLGAGGAMTFLAASRITFGNEGQIMSVVADPALFVSGLLLALVLGGMASAYPAWQAARRPIVESLRA